MARRHYNLPPFTTLSAFEAAARHLSFKDAAQELSVTPGAVSHQVKAIEGELGVILFQRKHRGVELTPEGEALYETLASTFGQISRQVSRIRQTGEADAVRVGSTTAVAAMWLSPAVIRFWRENPDINVHQVTQDRPFQSARNFDFFICYGRPQTSTLSETPIYRDELVPVASPDIARELTGQGLAHLARQRLIHLESPSPTWTRWSEWFDLLGYEGDIASGTRVTSYSVALQIAGKGAGVALGWRRLIRPLLDSGELQVIGSASVPAPNRFYLAGLPEAQLSEGARKLRAWLLAEAQDARFRSDHP